MGMNKEEKIRYILDELIGKGDLGFIDTSYTTDYVAHAGEKKYSGHSFLKSFSEQLRTAIPNLSIVDVKFLAQDEGIIVWQRTLSGTHKVKMQGIPASGKKLKWVDMVVTHFDGEKIAEEWVVSELMGELLLKASKA